MRHGARAAAGVSLVNIFSV
jgi:hypothetical protein